MIKKLPLFIALLLGYNAFSQSTNCTSDIIYNGSWTGGSGLNGTPNDQDENKGILIQSDVKIDTDFTCKCLTIENGFTLSVGSNSHVTIIENLNLDGDLRLLNKSQMIQKHLGENRVTGNGKLWIDQNSIVSDVYRYTYWSTPVKNSTSNNSYQVSSIMFDGTAPTSEDSVLKAINWQPFDGTLSSLDGATTDPITISNYWIFGMFNGTSNDDWTQKLDLGTFSSGMGYLMKGSGVEQNFTFSGIPNDGLIEVDLQSETTTLTGNPYPSALDSDQFFEDNPHITELYFWDHSSNEEGFGHWNFFRFSYYTIRNYATGISGVRLLTNGENERILDAPGRYIPVGSGFMVISNEDRPMIFNNEQRAFATKANSNEMFIKDEEQEKSILKFGFEFELNNFEYHQQAAISFIDGNTFSDEPGYDSRTGLALSNIYFRFPESEEDLIIAGIEEVREGLEFPLSVNLEESQTIKLMIDEAININHSYVFIDKQTGIEYDIANNEISLDLIAGNYQDRFFVQFRRPNQEVSTTNDLLIYSADQEVIIKPFNDTTIQSYVVYNVLGQELISSPEPSSLVNEVIVRIPTQNFATGVLLVNVQTDKGLFKEKLILH